MSQVLAKLNIKRSKTLSLFKVAFFLLIAVFIDKIWFYILCVILLFFLNKKSSLFLLIIICAYLLLNYVKCDFIPFGIVERDNSSYYLVNKGLYYVKLYDDKEYKAGDVLTFEVKGLSNTSDSDLRNNYLYTSYSSTYLFSLKFKNQIYERACSYGDNVSSFMLKQFYNINDYNYSNDLLNGMFLYYLFKSLKKYHSFIPLILIIVYSVFFGFNVKFCLIIIDCILDLFKLKKIDTYALKIIIIILYNKYLLTNYAFLINLLFQVNYLFGSFIDNKTFFCLISSFLFGKINLLNSFFYKQIYYLKLVLIFLAILVLIIPTLFEPFNSLLNVLNKIDSISGFTIRGKLSIFALIIFILYILYYKYANWLIDISLIALLILLPFNNPFAHISFIDVGQGDAILIKGEFNKYNILIDTGSKYNYSKLSTYLYKEGIYKIDYLIITHDDEDHAGNLDSLQEDFNIDNVIRNPIDISVDKLTLKNYYLQEYDNDNDNSLVYMTNINGLSFLFTGDISSEVERQLVNKLGPLNFDFLKVSHHGSDTATSDYFVANTLPHYAVISTSGKYNHPAKSVIATLEKYGVGIFNTKESGNIEIYFTCLGNLLKTDKNEFVIIKE